MVIGLTMVQMLDTHFETKLSREAIAAKLHNDKLEADLYPVGSWRDHPPTGILLDLSQPHAEPPASKTTDDDDDDDRSQTRNTPPIQPRAPSLRRLSEGKAVARVGGQPPSMASDLSRHEDPAALRALLGGLPSCDSCTPGSNNWVIAGSHTASGKPLLSNDMHLGLSVPNIWYIADLAAPGYHAAGVTLPGMPFVIAGHNDHVAWGFTALYADVQDLYIEKLDGKGNYEGNDAVWHPLSVDQEVIHVRGSKDVEVDVKSTDHGPLLNPIFTKETRPIALKWTLYDPSLSALPIYALNTASNWTEFSAALEKWCWPTQNVVYSDDQGHIAYHAVGKVPIRWDGIGVFDRPLPHDTMNLRYEWGLGPNPQPLYIPFEAMPHAADPPSGFLATANARVTIDKPRYDPLSNNDFSAIPLTDEWVDPYRAERIYKLLQGRDGLTPSDMLAAQTDIYSEVDQELGHRFAYAIDHAAQTDDRLRQAADLMRSWDGRLSTDSAAASLVTSTRAALWPLILEPKLGKEADSYAWGEKNFAEEEIVMHANPDWLPSSYKNWDELLTDAVRKALNKGKAPTNVATWNYGSWHVLDLEHPLSHLLPDLLHLAGTGAQPLSGDTTTVKQVGRAFGPSQRFTMDWNNIDGSTENIVLGESGNPLSPHFRDQWNDWYNGTTFALPFTANAVTGQTRHTLRLLP